ncbi:hypothetical protein RDWZM_002396 [Blomia tropicalis]|uniref:Kazal-like domain-containing protein n=1 Tax=Blomia tropicalis TaxID=40697 RepID=A0A9Q0RRK4_BLOTA|nr:hypothetical protein RDWZM_002396 [Blomia tropicalis]
MSFSKSHNHHPHRDEYVDHQMPTTSVQANQPPQTVSQMVGGHHNRISMTNQGHRRAKSAGQASSFNKNGYDYYAATGLYAHQSGEQLDSATVASAAASQLWTIAPIVKRTASDVTLRQLEPPPYSSDYHQYHHHHYHHHHHHLHHQYGSYHPYGHTRRHSSVKYSSLKGGIPPPIGSEKVDVDDQPIGPDEECGCWSLSLPAFQPFARIQIFVFLCSILVTLQQALSSGYFNSVITTIEKRFDISSQMSGAIVSTFELGNLATIIFVSYFGTHRHIPRWIGTGIVVTAIGSLIFAVPHFMSLSPGLDVNSSRNPSGDDNTCRIPQPQLSSPFLEKASQFINPPLGSYHETIDDPTCIEADQRTIAPQMLVFMLAMVLIGCGGTPIFTLGTTYIDDHVPKESSSMYMGCMYSMVAFGLVCGFLLGGYFINVHENALGTGITPPDIFPGHPKWIGAWWLGFILLGILLLVISIPFFLFPKTLKPKRMSKEAQLMVAAAAAAAAAANPPVSQSAQPSVSTNTETSNVKTNLVLAQEDGNARLDSFDPYQKKYGRSLGEIPACMWRLATNPIYMVTCLGSCMELAIVSGFLIFLPKYLETQFSLGKSEANLFAGGIAIPGACVGIFLGGYLLKRLQLSPKGAIQLVLFFNLLCMALYTALYFLGCENVRMAGTTLPYANTSHFDTFRVNLTADCNLGCRCSSNDLEPVCDLRSKISYYSPCFAGCTSVDYSGQIQNYSNCACLPPPNQNSVPNSGLGDVTMVPLVVPGPCPQLCNAMLPFMILLFVITLVVSITQMPVVMITLRSVAEEERSLALGMQFVLFRLFGYIPSPIVFGNVIDSTCLVWKAHCGQQGGFCLLYNIEQFRLRYVGVCSALKITAALLFFLDWLLICYREKKEIGKLMPKFGSPVDELVSSIISLDRLSVFGANGSANGGNVACGTITEIDEEAQPLSRASGSGTTMNHGDRQDSDYNSAIDEYEEEDDEIEDDDEVNNDGSQSSEMASTLVQPTNENVQPSTISSNDIFQMEIISTTNNNQTRHRRNHSQSHFNI